MAAGVVGVGRWLVVSLPHRWCGLTVGGFGLFVLRVGWLVVVWLVLVLRWVSLCLWLGTRVWVVGCVWLVRVGWARSRVVCWPVACRAETGRFGCVWLVRL